MSGYKLLGLTGIVTGAFLMTHSILSLKYIHVEKPNLIKKVYEINVALRSSPDIYLEAERDSIMAFSKFGEERDLYLNSLNEAYAPVWNGMFGSGMFSAISLLYLVGISRIEEAESRSRRQRH